MAMKIAVHGKEFDPGNLTTVQEFFNTLESQGAEIICSEDYLDILRKSGIILPAGVSEYGQSTLPAADFLFSLGGDGTLLQAVTHVGAKEIPIVGVNMGRLGFLATTAPEDLKKAVKAVFSGRFDIDKRVLLKLDSNINVFGDLNFALNDFTILKKDTSSMIVVKTYVDDEFLNAYWADGLIIATPTGSTGYSLSCGGPLVLPQSNNFIITPVSPHNLNVRPMVLADHSVISFTIDSRSDNVLLSLDSRSETVSSSIQMKIYKQDFNACLVKFSGYHPFDTLRMKLNWGLDARN
jgi:NAD+ kinase